MRAKTRTPPKTGVTGVTRVTHHINPLKTLNLYRVTPYLTPPSTACYVSGMCNGHGATCSLSETPFQGIARRVSHSLWGRGVL